MRSVFAALLLFGTTAMADCLIPTPMVLSEYALQATALLPADLDGDASPDLAGTAPGGVWVSINEGGALRSPVTVHAGTVTASLVAADLDGDGKADLAFGQGNAIVILRGKGDGTFGAARSIATTFAPSELAAARLNGDDARDLVALDASANALVAMSGDGAGNFVESGRSDAGEGPHFFLATDLDGDGWTDVVLTSGISNQLAARYGRGDGTLHTPVTISGPTRPGRMAAGDVTGDGLTDLVVLTTEIYGSVHTIRNLGSRAFSDPIGLSSRPAMDVAIADLTGDDIAEPVVATPCGVRGWRSTGLGTMNYGWLKETREGFCQKASDATAVIAVADFDGDARVDVVASYFAPWRAPGPLLTQWQNRCGEGSLTLAAEAPTISVGQAARVTASIDELDPYVTAPGRPTAVSLRRAGEEVAVAELQEYQTTAVFTLTDLPVGDHVFTAVSTPNEQYGALASKPLTIRVVAETTTTSVTVDPAAPRYGEPVRLTARVTSSTGATTTGPIRFTVAGANYTGVAPEMMAQGTSAVGTQNYRVEFLGNASFPPSVATGTYEVAKETPLVFVDIIEAVAGRGAVVLTSVRAPQNVGIPTGAVTLRVAGHEVTSTALDDQWRATLPPLRAGRYDLEAHYAGDGNFTTASTVVPLIIFPTAASSVDAHGTADGITLTWSDTAMWTVSRRQAGGVWTMLAPINFTYVKTMVDGSAVAGQVYLYRTEKSGATVSEADVGVRVAFTDDPLTAGTVIKAAHMSEIIRAANLLRKAAALPEIADDTAVGAPVTAARILALRGAINEARVALGAYPYPFGAEVAAGATIRASDFTELREAVR